MTATFYSGKHFEPAMVATEHRNAIPWR